MHPPKQKCVSLLTFWCGKRDLFRQLSSILFRLLYWLSWEPAFQMLIWIHKPTWQRILCTRPSRSVYPYWLFGVGKGISSGNFLQFYLDCYTGSPGNPDSECLYGSRNLRDIGPYAPDQAEVCILTDFLVWEKCISSGNFLQFYFDCYIGSPGARIPNAYPDPQTNKIADPMHLAKKKCVSLPTSGVGKGASSGILARQSGSSSP